MSARSTTQGSVELAPRLFTKTRITAMYQQQGPEIGIACLVPIKVKSSRWGMAKTDVSSLSQENSAERGSPPLSLGMMAETTIKAQPKSTGTVCKIARN